MAADQGNFQYFTYVDDGAVTWNKRGSDDAACHAVDGSAALTAGSPVWDQESRRMHTRKAVFQDPTTFRSKRCIIYTAAAFAALTSASSVNVHVPGETATVAYNLKELIPEKRIVASAARQLADHA